MRKSRQLKTKPGNPARTTEDLIPQGPQEIANFYKANTIGNGNVSIAGKGMWGLPGGGITTSRRRAEKLDKLLVSAGSESIDALIRNGRSPILNAAQEEQA